MKEFIISNFELTYDGMFLIHWNNQILPVYLEIQSILSMLAIEGISHEELMQKRGYEPIHFSKATLRIWGSEINGRVSYITSEFSDEYIGRKKIVLFEVEVNEG